MPDPSVAVAIVLLVTLVEASRHLRVPTGLLLAAAMLAADAELLVVAILGAIGVMLARLSLAMSASRQSEQRRTGSTQDVIRERLASSPAYARSTFMLAALPLVPAGVLFPLLGAARVPLWPSLAGSIVGRIPILALTTAIFSWIALAFTDGDESEAASALGVVAIILLVLASISRIDWDHRARTGAWRMRDDPDPLARFSVLMGSAGGDGQDRSTTSFDIDASGEVIDGELVDEDVDGEDPRELPRSE